jgi:uncharacterized membrane protein SirB2
MLDWRKVLDTVSLILGLLVLACMKNGLESTWWAALAAGLLVYIVARFTAFRLVLKQLSERM